MAIHARGGRRITATASRSCQWLRFGSPPTFQSDIENRGAGHPLETVLLRWDRTPSWREDGPGYRSLAGQAFLAAPVTLPQLSSPVPRRASRRRGCADFRGGEQGGTRHGYIRMEPGLHRADAQRPARRQRGQDLRSQREVDLPPPVGRDEILLDVIREDRAFSFMRDITVRGVPANFPRVALCRW